jgi:hypothetical protein
VKPIEKGGECAWACSFIPPVKGAGAADQHYALKAVIAVHAADVFVWGEN